MSKIIATAAIRGAHQAVNDARLIVNQAINEKGSHHPVAFTNTAYYLPVIYSHLGIEISTVGQMEQVLIECDNLLPPIPSEKLWLPYLGQTLNAGMATLFAYELIEACKTIIGSQPVNGIWLGAADDVIMRERGVEFVDGSAPGFAAIVGCAPDADAAVKLARELQSKNLYVFMAGNVPIPIYHRFFQVEFVPMNMLSVIFQSIKLLLKPSMYADAKSKLQTFQFLLPMVQHLKVSEFAKNRSMSNLVELKHQHLSIAQCAKWMKLKMVK
jgi:hypothetical protein